MMNNYVHGFRNLSINGISFAVMVRVLIDMSSDVTVSWIAWMVKMNGFANYHQK
jgi:hypothetical protein